MMLSIEAERRFHGVWQLEILREDTMSIKSIKSKITIVVVIEATIFTTRSMSLE
jgi:hypothetical protein